LKFDTKTGATVVLVVMAVVYITMLVKGIDPPAGFEQIMVGAAATIFVTQDRKATTSVPPVPPAGGKTP
jgi:hypothetical protein